jgi:hypothetical protein
MPLRVEAWFEGGVLRGAIGHAGHLRDVLETSNEMLVQAAAWTPTGQAAGQPAGDVRVSIDDVILAVSDEVATGPVHAAWHPIRLAAGPYVIEGDLATMPGFDPGRALARPTGTFVLLCGVRVHLAARPELGEAAHQQAFVNRYAVDAVEADLMLGFFFPGARMDAEATVAVDPVPSGG